MYVIIKIIGFYSVQTEESHAAGVIPRITLKIREGYFRIKFTYIISPSATVDIFLTGTSTQISLLRVKATAIPSSLMKSAVK